MPWYNKLQSESMESINGSISHLLGTFLDCLEGTTQRTIKLHARILKHKVTLKLNSDLSLTESSILRTKLGKRERERGNSPNCVSNVECRRKESLPLAGQAGLDPSLPPCFHVLLSPNPTQLTAAWPGPGCLPSLSLSHCNNRNLTKPRSKCVGFLPENVWI